MRYLDKPDEFEEFLNELNAAVALMPRPQPSPSPLGSAQIVGLPRSGTTLAYQLLARTGLVGYPSNVMAFFHQTPWVGAKLQVALGRNEPTLSLTSTGGRTPEPLDPHEFGYFWRRVCGHSANTLVRDLEPLPPPQLQLELDLVADTFGTPVVYKNFLALAHAREMRKELQRMSFIVVERDLLDVAASLLQLRQHLRLGMGDMAGVTPANMHKAPDDVIGSVAFQVNALAAAQRVCEFDVHRDSIVIPYRDLTRFPRSTVARILEHLGMSVTTSLKQIPEELPTGRGADGLERTVRADLASALTRTEESSMMESDE